MPFENRRERLREKIRAKGLDGLLVSGAANRYYLSGFELHDPQCNETAGFLVIGAKGADRLLTDPRYEDAAKRLWPENNIVIYTGRKNEQIRDLLKDQGFSKLGFEPGEMSADLYMALKDEIPLAPAGDLVPKLRMVKDGREIEALKRSCELNHRVMRRVKNDLLKPGVSEKELAWQIERMFREYGAEELAFSSIVAVNKNAALPHAVPGDDVIEEGCLVLVDTGARVDEYCSDQTRTFWVGETPSDRFREVRDLVRQAQTRAIEGMGPGIKFKDAYDLAKKHFQDHGVQDRFTHSLGHGIGLETHEPPSLNPNAEGELEPGMVVTVEPGLYYPDWGGVRWEYMVLITENGAEAL